MPPLVRRAALTVLAILCMLIYAAAPVGAEAAPAPGAGISQSGTRGTVTWELYSDGTLVIRPTEGDEGTMSSTGTSYNNAPWYSVRSSIKAVETQGTIHLQGSAAYLFYQCAATSLDLSGFDTSGVTNMSNMFDSCQAASLDLSGFDTSGVTKMYCMFYKCQATSIEGLSGFDTSNVTSMGYMFDGCRAENLDLSGFDTSNVTNMGYMFCGCRAENLDLSGFDTSSVTDMSSMFNGCKATSLDLTSFDTSSVTKMNGMFRGCNATSIEGLSGFDTSSVANMSDMFYECKATSLDLTGFDTSSVTDMSGMFEYSAVASLDLTGWDTTNVTDMSSMFYRCAATTLDLSGWDTSRVTNMSDMFHECKATSIEGLSGFNTSSVTDMSDMFYYCRAENLDLSGFDTSSVTDMGRMFRGCNATSIEGLSGFDTSSVTDMSSMFYGGKSTSLDLTGWDTSSVTNMSNMFSYCQAANLDLSGFNTSSVANMSDMFNNCQATVLDLSGFDTSGVTNMSNMFKNSKVSAISLGSGFRFKGNGSTACTLPAPSTSTTTGKWVREDQAVEAKTPVEIRDGYDANAAAWAGTWVWDVKSTSAVVRFDAKGGYTAQAQINLATASAITMPLASRPAYIFKGWNTSEDGSGASYQAGGTFTPAGGTTTTFYAQWEKAAKYTVRHFQQNVAMTGYDLIETEYFFAEKNTPVSPEPKTYKGFITPATQTAIAAEDDTSVVDYHYDRTSFTVRFKGNGATSGSMEDQAYIGGIVQRLSDNKFKKENAAFNGWNTAADGTGASYGDAQAVADLAGDGGTAILYAQWLGTGDAAHGSVSGSYTVKAKPGQTVTIPELPAGTRYRITENDVPDGWAQEGAEGTEGTISPNETSAASVTNRYSASGKASIRAYKFMADGAMEEGQFLFQLLKGNETVATAANGTADMAEEILAEDGETVIKNPYYGMSVINFEDIPITAAGNYTFTIREVTGSDNGIEYDMHTETVSVAASDNGDGTLTCTAAYDSDGPVFTNRRIPSFEDPQKKGRLVIKKDVGNLASQQAFPFTVRLYDAEGTELTESYACDIVRKGHETGYMDESTAEESAVSHTMNLDDAGNKLSNYGNNWGNSSIRGTGREEASQQAHVVAIEGANELDVTIVYGGESASWDWVCMWQGAHEDYTAAANYGSSITGKLGGGNHGNASNIKTYKVPGDTVTFSYKSDGGGYGDGYGYYATVTAQVTKTEYKDGFISTQDLHSGSSVSITENQSAVIRDIPAGASYKVTEGSTAGYELVISEGTEGSIPEDAAAEASFTNVYDGRGRAQVHMTKTFAGGRLEGGEFTFRLLDGDGEIIDETTNDASGGIAFKPIEYTSQDIGNRYMYTAVEVPGDDGDILYDTHEENVIIEVSDGGDGNLTADVQYRGSGAFRNSPKNSPLKVKKEVTGNMGDRTSEFTFTATLRDGNGAPCTKAVPYTKGGESGTLTPTGEGKIAFSLGGGDEIIFDLPYGTRYAVTEAEADTDGYTTSMENTEGTIAQENADVVFINSRDMAIPTNAGERPAYLFLLLPAGAAAAIAVCLIIAHRKRRWHL